MEEGTNEWTEGWKLACLSCHANAGETKKAKLFANSGDPDHSVASDLGLHCLPISLLCSFRLK